MFKYEMHIHSRPCSGGGDEIENHITELKKKGYAGMVITNHFINGDTKIDRTLSWPEFVEAYREDYERGRIFAEQLDFDLLFGIEEQVGNGKEILVYGISPDFLERNPSLKSGDAAEYARLVHNEGGLVFQAHPYRDRFYITDPGPIAELELLDGIEVYNAANEPEENKKAALLAKEKGLRCTVGSDGHSKSSAGRTAIVSKERIRTNEKLVEILKSGDYGFYIEQNQG